MTQPLYICGSPLIATASLSSSSSQQKRREKMEEATIHLKSFVSKITHITSSPILLMRSIYLGRHRRAQVLYYWISVYLLSTKIGCCFFLDRANLPKKTHEISKKPCYIWYIYLHILYTINV